MQKDSYKNLYAVYKKPAGLDGEKEKMIKLEEEGVLERGTLYKVKRINMGSSFTSVYLLNVPAALNSVALDFYEVTKQGVKECDIFKDARYNPYYTPKSQKTR